MATAIPDLWSDDIDVSVLTPIAILRKQADLLRQKTKGILEVDVTMLTSDKNKVLIHFDIVAPALASYRHRLLEVTHKREFAYPAFVAAVCFEHLGFQTRQADTEEEFMVIVSDVFRSGETRSVLQSLIARSNEETQSSTGPDPLEEQDN